MNSIKVLDLFNASAGVIAILTFPDNEYPKIGMILKREDGVTWKITGIAMPKLSEMTNGYKYLEPPCTLYDCKIQAQSLGSILATGDYLSIL